MAEATNQEVFQHNGQCQRYELADQLPACPELESGTQTAANHETSESEVDLRIRIRTDIFEMYESLSESEEGEIFNFNSQTEANTNASNPENGTTPAPPNQRLIHPPPIHNEFEDISSDESLQEIHHWSEIQASSSTSINTARDSNDGEVQFLDILHTPRENKVKRKPKRKHKSKRINNNPTVGIDDLRRIFLPGDKIKEFLNTPYLSLVAIGSYVRLRLQAAGVGSLRIFKIGQIVGILESYSSNKNEKELVFKIEYNNSCKEDVPWNPDRFSNVPFQMEEFIVWATGTNLSLSLDQILHKERANLQASLRLTRDSLLKSNKSRIDGGPGQHMADQQIPSPLQPGDLLSSSGSGVTVNFATNSTHANNWRPIVIHGSSVAFEHGRRQHYSCRGLEICVMKIQKDYPGCNVEIIYPEHILTGRAEDYSIIQKLKDRGILKLKQLPRIRTDYYDKICVINRTKECNGILISNADLSQVYRNSRDENWKSIIRDRILMFTWVGDNLMFPADPLGRNGPTLKEFLMFSSSATATSPRDLVAESPSVLSSTQLSTPTSLIPCLPSRLELSASANQISRIPTQSYSSPIQISSHNPNFQGTTHDARRSANSTFAASIPDSSPRVVTSNFTQRKRYFAQIQ